MAWTRETAGPAIIDVVTSKRDKKRQHEIRRAAKQRHEDLGRIRSLVGDIVGVASELRDAASDLATPPERFAELLAKRLKEDGPFHRLRDPSIAVRGVSLTNQLGDQAGERAADIARSLQTMAGEQGAPSAPSASATSTSDENFSVKAAMLWWAASFYQLAGQAVAADAAATEAFELADGREPATPAEQGSASAPTTVEGDDPTRVAARALAQLRLDVRRYLGAARVALELCEADPFDVDSMNLLAVGVTNIARRQADPPPAGDPCVCASGTAWSECCRGGEEELLASVTDRSTIRALHASFDQWAARDPKAADWLHKETAQWSVDPTDEEELRGSRLEVTLDSGIPASGVDPLARIATETVWQRGPQDDDPDAEGSFAERIARDSEDPNRDSLIRRFADDPATPPGQRELALGWSRRAECGLWQVEDPSERPGLWLTDLVTNSRRWVHLGPSQIVDLPRWTVLAGTIVPDRGVWRSATAFARLYPFEAERAVEVLQTATEAVAIHMARELGLPGSMSDNPRRPLLDDPPPHGVLADLDAPMERESASMHHTVTGLMLANLLGDISVSRARASGIKNSDGEAMEMLNAIASLQDPSALRQVLVRRPDFDEGDRVDGSVQLVWHGRDLTAAEEQSTLESARQAMVSRGLDPASIQMNSGPRRWVRGTVTIFDDYLSAEVNSLERLGALARILGRAGVTGLSVTRRLDKDLGGRSLAADGRAPLHSPGSPVAEHAWIQSWIHEESPLLGGRSPLMSVDDDILALRLEQLLRDFEHDADIAELRGTRPTDTAALRRALVDANPQSKWAATFAGATTRRSPVHEETANV